MYIRVLLRPVLLSECLLHLVSCVTMLVNTVCCVSLQVFKKAPAHFPHFFRCVMESCLSGEQLGLSLKEQTVLLLFLDHCFNSLVRSHASHFLNRYQSSSSQKCATLPVVFLITWWHCCFAKQTIYGF